MPTSALNVLRVCLWLAPVALLQIAGSAADQHGETSMPKSGISLSPSVVTLTGQPGQSHRQTLRLINHTSRELAFRLEAQDVVTEDGRRLFAAAGERAGSVAATAVFSPKEVVIAPGAVGTADVTITLPRESPVRGVAAVFRGSTVVGNRGAVAMTASLGSLITFTLSSNIRLEAATPQVSPQSETSNLAVMKWVTNTGTEPVVASGAVAILDEAGGLVGKVPVEPQRLMPGERLPFGLEFPTTLAPGRYRAVLSLEYDDHARKVLTRTADITVPAAGDDRRDVVHRGGTRR